MPHLSEGRVPRPAGVVGIDELGACGTEPADHVLLVSDYVSAEHEVDVVAHPRDPALPFGIAP